VNRNQLWVVPIVFMAIGILDLPYGYYHLLKLVVCASSIYFAYKMHTSNDTVFQWVFVFFAILYNPIVPIYLYEKEIWVIVNLFTAIAFYLKREAFKNNLDEDDLYQTVVGEQKRGEIDNERDSIRALLIFAAIGATVLLILLAAFSSPDMNYR
jgi:hypothetical protein